MSKTPRATVAQVIASKLAAASADSSLLAREIAAYLMAEGREQELESLMRDTMALREHDGVTEADVSVAHPLNADELKQLSELVRSEFSSDKNRVLIAQTVDPHVIGGVRIDTAHEQLDLTVRGKLDTFKRLTSQGKIS